MVILKKERHCSTCGKFKKVGNLPAFLSFLVCKCPVQVEGNGSTGGNSRQISGHGRRTALQRREEKAARAAAIDLASQHLAIGNILGGNYRLLEKIGQGGMGLVFRASHVVIDAEYAVKVLAPEETNESSWLRFQSEARTMAALSHPTFVKVYDLGVHEGLLPFYVMDLLKGVSLESLVILKGRLSLKLTVAIFSKILDGLAYAHRNGIIHRDLKPSNIMLCGKLSTNPDKLTVKILDFGIAKSGARGGLNSGSGKDSYEIQSLTAKGELLGSPAYMSPEQCLGKEADARSDIYSVGCCLFETLTGFIPFDAQSAAEIISLHLYDAPPKLSDMVAGEFPSSLEYIVARCLAKEPSERYQSAKELAIDLARVGEGRDLKRYRPDKFQAVSDTVEGAKNSRAAGSETNSFPWVMAVGIPAVLVGVFICWLLLTTPAARVADKASRAISEKTTESSDIESGEFFYKEVPNMDGYVEIHYPAQGGGEFGVEGTRLSVYDPVMERRQSAVPVTGVLLLDSRKEYWLYADRALIAHPGRLKALSALKITMVTLESTEPPSTDQFCRALAGYFSPHSLSLRAGSKDAATLLSYFPHLQSFTIDGVLVGPNTEALEPVLEKVEGVKLVDVEDVDNILRLCLKAPRLTAISLTQKTIKRPTILLLRQVSRATVEIDIADAGDATLINLIENPCLKSLTISWRPWSDAVIKSLRARKRPLLLRLMGRDLLPGQLQNLSRANPALSIDLVSPGILGTRVQRTH